MAIRAEAMRLDEITHADAILLDYEPTELEVLEIQMALDVHRSGVPTTVACTDTSGDTGKSGVTRSVLWRAHGHDAAMVLAAPCSQQGVGRGQGDAHCGKDRH